MGNIHAFKKSYPSGWKYGKVNTLLNEKLMNVKWGKFRYYELFKTCVVSNKLTKTSLDSEGEIPVYSSESANNGIIGYTKHEPEFIISNENPVYIIFGDHTLSFNIATKSFCVMDNVKVLSLNEKYSIKTILYIISSWKKCIPNKGYSRHWSFAKEILFDLPLTQSGKLNFEFMENFITELQAEYLEKLKKYLLETGLKDYILTKDEEKALQEFETLQFQQFNVIDEFTVQNTKSILSRDIVKNSGNIPYLCASTENNAISSYISYDQDYIDKGNCVFIGGKTFVVSYQENDFYSNDSHNLALYIKNKKYQTRLNQLYLATCIEKSLSYKYSWGDSISNKKIQKDKISLPCKNNQPNFIIMKTFISAIQKIIIKDMVLYVDAKIKNSNNN